LSKIKQTQLEKECLIRIHRASDIIRLIPLDCRMNIRVGRKKNKTDIPLMITHCPLLSKEHVTTRKSFHE